METSNPSIGSLLHTAISSSPFILEESRWDDSQREEFVSHILRDGGFGSITVCSATRTVVEGSDRLRCLLEPGSLRVNLRTLRVSVEDGEDSLPLSMFLGSNAAPQVRAALRGQPVDVLLAAEKVLQVLSWPAVPVFMTGQSSLAMSRQVVRIQNRFR